MCDFFDFLRDVIKTIWWGLTSRNPVVIVFSALGGLVVAVVAYVILMFSFKAADSWFLPEASGVALVGGKGYSAENTSFMWVSDANGGGYMLPITVPETHYLNLIIGSQKDCVSVSKTLHTSVSIGSYIAVRYRLGRMSKDLYITQILH